MIKIQVQNQKEFNIFLESNGFEPLEFDELCQETFIHCGWKELRRELAGKVRFFAEDDYSGEFIFSTTQGGYFYGDLTKWGLPQFSIPIECSRGVGQEEFEEFQKLLE